MRKAKFTKPFTLALPEDLYQRIKGISDQQGVSMGEIVREVLEGDFSKQSNERDQSLSTPKKRKE